MSAARAPGPPARRSLPSGTVTFLFTDIEGSTRLLLAMGDAYGDLLAEHRGILERAIDGAGGVVFGTEGDAIFAAFPRAVGAVEAAVAGQRGLDVHPWPPQARIRVRMGIHTGEARVVGDNYVGLDLHRVARIMAAGHGGQILISGATRALVEGSLPEGVTLRDVGERRLKDLSRPERIAQVVVPGLQDAFAELRTLDVTINNLPTQLTSFVGREKEVADGRRILETARLLTLTGPGGTGKSRLSLQIAAELADRFPDGTTFVALDTVTDPALVPSAIATALRLPESTQRTPLETLLDSLRDRRTLLVLDNFEQVLPAAPVVADILRASPGTTVVISSRAALRISGEREYEVPPLRLPDHLVPPVDLDALSRYEGVALFIERATAVRPDFVLNAQNALAVAEICARLDGLPLAIELAAARVKLLPPEAILARLGSRLGLLSGGARDLPARQQTLRGAIDWSYDLLDASAKRLLGRAAVFAGGMQLAHAEAVCGTGDELGIDVLDGLGGLVDHSLIRQVETDGEPRFAMLQVIREFALEQLEASGEADRIRERHLAAIVALVEDAEPRLTGPESRHWLDRLELEHDNVRVALAWAISTGRVEEASRIVGATWRFWHMRGHLAEGWDRSRAVLGMPVGSWFARRRALEAGAGIAYWRGRLEEAEPLYAEALERARKAGDRPAMAEQAYNLSFVHTVNKSDVPFGLRLAQEGLAEFRALGDEAGIAKSLWVVGQSFYFTEDFASALPLLREAVDRMRARDDRFGLAWAMHSLGLAEFRLRNLDGARAAWSEALRIFAAAQDRSGIGLELANFRELALARGDTARAARLGGATQALVNAMGMELALLVDELEGRAEEGGTGEAEARAEGARMSIDEAVALALADENSTDA